MLSKFQDWEAIHVGRDGNKGAHWIDGYSKRLRWTGSYSTAYQCELRKVLEADVEGVHREVKPLTEGPVIFVPS